MARYIDADLLTDKLEELQFNAPVMTPVMKIYNVIELVEDQPTADVQEVKRGKWIETKEWYFDEYAQSEYQRKCYECSICKRTELDKEPYCHCGAIMDGGKAE